MLIEGDDCMHAEEGLFAVINLVRVRSGGDDIGDSGVLLGQVG